MVASTFRGGGTVLLTILKKVLEMVHFKAITADITNGKLIPLFLKLWDERKIKFYTGGVLTKGKEIPHSELEAYFDKHRSVDVIASL